MFGRSQFRGPGLRPPIKTAVPGVFESSIVCGERRMLESQIEEQQVIDLFEQNKAMQVLVLNVEQVDSYSFYHLAQAQEHLNSSGRVILLFNVASKLREHDRTRAWFRAWRVFDNAKQAVAFARSLSSKEVCVGVSTRDMYGGAYILLRSNLTVQNQPDFDVALTHALGERVQFLAIKFPVSGTMSAEIASKIVALGREMVARKGCLMMVCEAPWLRQSFASSGMDGAFEWFGSLGEAESSWRQIDRMRGDCVVVDEATDLPECSYFKLRGGLDATNEIAFEGHVVGAQKTGRGKFLILDCAELKYVGSALGTLVATADNLEKLGGCLVLAAVPDRVAVVFEMLGLTSFFRRTPDVAAAQDFIRNWIARGKSE